jgi:hypothetical protein
MRSPSSFWKLPGNHDIESPDAARADIPSLIAAGKANGETAEAQVGERFAAPNGSVWWSEPCVSLAKQPAKQASASRLLAGIWHDWGNCGARWLFTMLEGLKKTVALRWRER